jgi:hypothetical protein
LGLGRTADGDVEGLFGGILGWHFCGGGEGGKEARREVVYIVVLKKKKVEVM